MRPSKKQKQHLAYIIIYTTRIKKSQKIEIESQQKQQFLSKQKEVQNFLDKYDNFQLVLSSNKLKFEEFSIDKKSINEKNLEINEQNLEVYKEDLQIDRRGNNI